MMTKGDRFISQVTSGRWLLTVTAGAAFFGFALAVCWVIVSLRATLKPETIVGMFSALLLVIQGCYKDYFTRQDRNGKHPDEPVPPKPPTDEPPAT